MASKLRICQRFDSNALIEIPKGYKLTVTNLIFDGAFDLATLTSNKEQELSRKGIPIFNGGILRFTEDTLAVANLFNQKNSQAMHLWWARTIRKDVELAPDGGMAIGGIGLKPKDEEIRKFFHSTEDDPTSFPRTFVTCASDTVFITLYEDEEFIPDHTDRGSSGWIVNKSVLAEVKRLLRRSSHVPSGRSGF